MIPEKNDSRWKDIVTTTTAFPLQGLAAKMLLMRVRTMTKLDPTPAQINEAIKIIYDFFSKNEETLKYDLEILFKKD